MLRLRSVLPTRGRLSKKVRFVGGRYIHVSERIPNMKEYESASFYGCYTTLCSWSRFGRNFKVYEPLRAGAKSVRMVYFATESVMGRVRKR